VVTEDRHQPPASTGTLGSEELSWCARASSPASQITPGSGGCPDNYKAFSTNQPSVNLALDTERVVQPVAGEAETDLP
jgi:hypothetical protein